MLRKNQKEILEIKNTATEMNNYFDELISTLDTAEERLSKLEDYFNRNIQTWKVKRKKTEKKEQNIPELWDNYKMCNINIMGISKGEKKPEEI